MLLQARVEVGEIDTQRIGADALEQLGESFEKFDTAELTDVVIYQGSVVELEQRARVLAGCGVPQQFAGHAEVDVEDAVIEIDENLLAAPADPLNDASGQPLRRLRMAAARHALRIEFGALDGAAGQMRRNRSNYGFDFGQFRQGD